MCERREKAVSVTGDAHSDGEHREKRFREERMSSLVHMLGLGHLWVTQRGVAGSSCIPRCDTWQE